MRTTLKINWKIFTILLFGFTNMIFSWKGDYEGGDIANARRSYLGSEPIDLWGAWSGFFYANLPDTFLPWGAWLFLIQISCTTLGLIFILNALQNTRQFPIKTYLTLTYFIISFSSYLTRDSTMACLFVLGLGLLFQASHKPKIQRLCLQILGFAFIVLAVSFRPWLSPVILCIYFYFFEIKIKTIAQVLFLLVSPIAIELLAFQSTNFKTIRPELQVMVMDSATLACISPNETTRLNATVLLNSLNKTNFSNSQLCTDYRYNSWQSVASFETSLSQMGVNENINLLESDSLIKISTELNSESYINFRKNWLYLIFNHPEDYIQVKLIQLSQTLISGDMSIFKLPEDNVIKNLIGAVYHAPYNFAVALHLLSPIMTLIFGTCFLLFKLKNYPVRKLLVDKQIVLIYIFLIAWVLLTTLAFIGDSGRFTYLSGFVFYLLALNISEKAPINLLSSK